MPFQNIMQARHEQLEAAVAGLKNFSVDFIGYQNGQIFPVPSSDDIGIYYFIPKLVATFNLSLDQGITLFFQILFYLSFSLGAVSLLLLSRNWKQRVASMVLLYFLATFSLINLSEVYYLPLFTTITLTPLFFLFFYRYSYRVFLIFMFTAGIVAYASHIVRSFSSLPVLLIIITGVAFSSLSRKIRAITIGVFFLGTIIPAVYFDYLLDKRDAFYSETANESTQIIRSHVFWHTAYLGLGYFPDNPYGIQWDDSNACVKARSLNPSLTCHPTREYEDTLRREVFRIAIHDPLFILGTIAKKIKKIIALQDRAVLFLTFFLGVAARKPLSLDVGFFLAFCAAMLPGIIAIPNIGYSFGVVTVVYLYLIVSLLFLFDNKIFARSPNQQ